MMVLSENRKAGFDYEVLETYEAGMELLGFEVKSIKTGRCSLIGAFAVVKDNQVWLLNANIPPYQAKNTPREYQPDRTRRLLLKKQEIKELLGKISQSGLTLVPLKIYSKRGIIKVLLGLARHKKKGDKRETIKKREIERDISRIMKRG